MASASASASASPNPRGNGNVGLMTAMGLKSVPHINANGRDKSGYNALHWLVVLGDSGLERVEALLRDPARLAVPLDDAANEQQQTALHWACAHGSLKCAAALIRDGGANVELADSMGCTPLMLATQGGHTLVVHFLITQAGARRDTVDSEGHTLLMWAVYKSHFKMAWYLLQSAHVDVNAVDKKGATALHWCAMRRERKMIPLLLRHGANVAATTPDNKTALNVAHDNNAYDCVHELMQPPGQLPQTVYPSSMWMFAVWSMTIPALLVLLHLHVALLCGALLVALVRIQSSNAMARHVVGKDAFRSAVTYAMQLGTGALAVYYTGRYLLPNADALVPNVVLVVCMTVMFGALYRLKQCGPGYVRSPDACDWSAVPPGRFCSFCVVHQPVRAHHCARCNRCVARFDHHCPFIDSCVGYDNNHHFLVMVVAAALSHVLFIWQCYGIALAALAQSDGFGAFLREWSAFLMFVFVVSVAQCVAEFVLVYAQLVGALNDTTTSEAHHLAQERMANPYDRGTATNVMQFCHMLPAHQQIDWRTKLDAPQLGFAITDMV